MKIIHFVPLVIVLIIATAWLANLRGSKSTVKQDNALLREKIANVRNASISQNEPASAKAKSEKKPSENEYKPSADWVSTSRDWKELVLFNNNESQYRFRYTAAWARLEKLASELSGDELVRAYTEMAALPVHAPFRHDLERVMLKELERKNPEFAFSQYIAKCQSEDSTPARIGKFNEWLARDPAAATAWYESQLAAGVFDKTLDGKSPAMVPFESAYIISLLASDPAAAEERMNKIPPDLRANLGAYAWDVPKENGKAFIDLLRKTMPMEQYMVVLRNTSMLGGDFTFLSYSNSDPESAKRSLDNFAFTPEERIALLANQFSDFAEYRAMRVSGGGDPRRNEFDANRKWIQAVDPSSADRATGIALQRFLKDLSNPESHDFVEKAVTDYLNSGAGDELLVPLIQGSANGSITYPKDRARGLAMKISDDKLRAELLQKLN